ncbi:MAG: general secretion pathway protein GspK, partial [Thermodesulfobacteriota bacterium]
MCRRSGDRDGSTGGAPGARLPRLLQSEKGIALIMVLWIMAFLMFIVIEFAYTMRIETDSVRNLKDETSARHLALAGINMGLAELGGEYDIVYLNDKGEVTLGRKEANEIYSVDVARDFDLGEGHVAYRIEDEGGRLNINTATREEIKELLLLTGVETTERDVIADSILDWRDKNHEFHFNGAEDEYYGELPEPYGAKDDKFDSREELLLVKGVTPAIFYGDDNVPYEFGVTGETNPQDPRPRHKGIARHITVTGSGKINLNTADATVLQAVLGKGKAMEVTLRRDTEGLLEWPLYEEDVTSDVFS